MSGNEIITSIVFLFIQEKIDALKVLGADVRPVPAVPFDNPENYNHQVKQSCDSHVIQTPFCIKSWS